MESKSGASVILDGISRKLDENFDGVNIYGDESVEQGLDVPAFFVAVLPPSRSPELGPFHRTKYPFDIHYFPAAKGSNAELLGVAEQLWDVLDVITVEGRPVRGTGMSYELADGVLHFFVSYSVAGRKAVPADPEMEEAAVKTSLKE